MATFEAESLLARSGWLGLCPEWFKRAVIENAVETQYNKGQRVQHSPAGEPIGIWGLAEGILSVGLDHLDRPDAVLHLAFPSSWGGAAEVILGRGKLTPLTARTDVTVLVLSAAKFREIASVDPEAWRWLALLPAINISTTIRIIDDLLIQSAKRRVASTLMRLSGHRPDLVPTFPRDVQLSQEELADAVNLSRTVLGEILQELSREGAIEKTYRTIRVIPERLAPIAEATNT
jgi:CRP/FNR family transcriptional regulator, cyclic AMP receptor protein